MPKPEAEKIPISLVTGFLGSGKTTLLNHILKLKEGRRVAVIENEVGEINIDNSLVVDQLLSKEDLVSMDKGCVCCSLRHDIVKALRELQRRASTRGSNYDCILLETTGLADPAPVAFTFFSNAWISANYRLDSIICLVDAQHISKHLEDATIGVVHEAVNQIAFADVILLNKIDLVTEDELQHARDLVRSINVTAELIECSLNGSGDEESKAPSWDTLMGINSFSIERALQVDPYFMDSDGEEEDGQPSPAQRSPQQPTAQEAQQAAKPADGAAPNAGGEREAGGAAATPSAAGEGLPEKYRGGAELVGGKRKVPEGEAELGECRQHSGPCDEHCAVHVEAAAAAGHAPAKQQQELALEGENLQRQPKRRRKKLHDLSGVGALGITARGPLDKHRFNMFMRDLLGEKARDIFRSKGVLSIKGQERTKFMFQGVHETICFGPAATGWADGEEPINQIVLIGRNLSRKDLVDGLRSCVWVPLPEGWQEHVDPRTNQPFYTNSLTGAKQWDRPASACALVHYSESSHMQPTRLQPQAAGAATGSPAATVEEAGRNRQGVTA